jgi:hypothetical protein
MRGENLSYHRFAGSRLNYINIERDKIAKIVSGIAVLKQKIKKQIIYNTLISYN